ncbi:MAG: histone deacetylase family protein [Pseudomonadota bacterium]
MRQTAYVTHPTFLLHDMGAGHPERPARLQAIDDQLLSQGIADFLLPVEARPATVQQLERAHDPGYVRALFAASPATGLVELDGDTLMNPHSLDAALHAAGACVGAVELVLGGSVDNAFCAVRPPGHHAERARAMGFCLFNNVAVGAMHALTEGGLARVAILDFDVHHGNGTEDIFAGNSQVLYCSIYQHPFYPHVGPGKPAANIIRCPLPAGSDGLAYRHALEATWLPAMLGFKPQMLFISAGFDAHQRDPLADMLLGEQDFQQMTQVLVDFAADHCDGRIVSTLEGGYDLDALARCACVHLRSLMAL